MKPGRTRSIADRERDLRAITLKRQGSTYDQIAAEMGYADYSGAYKAVQRGLQDACREEASELVAMEAERLDALRRMFEKIAATKHLVISLHSGKVVMDPMNPDVPLEDDAPVQSAGLALLKVSESWRKLKGLDAPARKPVEVCSEDAVDAAIKTLEAEMNARDAADHSGTS